MAIKKFKCKVRKSKLYDSWIHDLESKGVDSAVYSDDDALNALVENKPDKMMGLKSLPKIGNLVIKLDHIEITTPPNKVKYNVGDNIDTTGMVITAYYTDNTNEVISDYTIDINRPIIDDDTEFIVSYTYKEVTKTATQGIESDRVLSSIKVSTAPTKTTYNHGDTFNKSGMVITAVFTDGETNVLDYTVNKTTLSYTDTSVTISYTFNGVTKTVNQNIVVNRVLTSIYVSNAPSKTSYTQYQSFSTSGMVITATYTDGGTSTVTGYTYSPTGSLSTLGYNNITIYYTLNGVTKTCTQQILVLTTDTYKNYYYTKNVGDIITIPHSTMGNIDFIVIGKNQDGSGKLTLLSKNIIKIMAFDAKESSNPITHRSWSGNSRYRYSNILQWMNSNASSNWYTAKHSYDAIPNSSNVNNGWCPYDSIPGFLYGFSDDFKNALTTVSKRTVIPTCDGGGYEDVSSKMFLLSRTEVGLSNENNIAEGIVYTYFSNGNSRAAYPSSYAINDSSTTYTHSDLSTSNVWHYWLRTPCAESDYLTRRIYDGSDYWDNNVGINHSDPYYGNQGLRVACVI